MDENIKESKKKRRGKETFDELKQKWLSGQLQTAKREGANHNLVKLLDNNLPVATGCKQCKKVFALNIGKAQKNHECLDPIALLYSPNVFENLKSKLTTMCVKDFASFNTHENPGFQDIVIYILQLGLVFLSQPIYYT